MGCQGSPSNRVNGNAVTLFTVAFHKVFTAVCNSGNKGRKVFCGHEDTHGPWLLREGGGHE